MRVSLNRRVEKAASDGGNLMNNIFDSGKIKVIIEKNKPEKKHTIMIVDDEEAHLLSMKSMLADDYFIITAGNGIEALEIIKGIEQPQNIKLIICDQRMPRLTGIELLKKLKDIIPYTIRIILTAFVETDIDEEAVKTAQIHQVITKPFEPENLKEKIKIAIQTADTQQPKN